MNETEADQIIDDLRKNRIYSNDQINSYLQSTGTIKSKDDMIQILIAMTRNQDYNNFYIQDHILECAIKNNSYINLIMEISKDNRFLQARSKLINLYQTNQEITEFVYEKLNEMMDDHIGFPLGFILGGWGLNDAKKIYQIIRDNKKPNLKERIAYTIALQIISERETIPEDLIDFIITNLDLDDLKLLDTTIFSLISRFASTIRVRKKLEELSHKNIITSIMIVRTVGIFWNQERDLAMKLLAICSEIDDSRLIDEVARSLGMFAPNYPIECLTIIRKWLSNPNLQRRLYRDWFVSQIGKGDIKKINDFIKKWIDEEKDQGTMIFHLPIIIDEIYASNDKQLMELLQSVDYCDKTKSSLIVNALDQILSHGYGEVRREDSFINDCNDLLSKIAKAKDIPIRVDPQVKNPIIKTLSVISQIKQKVKVNQDDAKKMLGEIPNLTSFIGQDQLEKLIDENPFHPLVVILSNSYALKSKVQDQLRSISKEDEWKKPSSVSFSPSKFYPLAFLLEIDAAIFLLLSEKQGLGSIRDALLNEQSFFQTVTEIVTAARFKKAHKILLQPRVNENKFDVQVTIRGKDHLIEIYSPDMDIKLKYVNKVHGMANRAKRGILEKLDTQLHAAISEHKPVILIVDRTRSDFGEMEIMDTILGSYQWVIIMDNEKGNVVNDYATRAKDSIVDVSPHGGVISAIVLVDRDIDYKEYKIKMSGKIFVNPQATIPLDEQTIKEIENSLFGNSLS